jgi:hypothetical protein
VGLRRSGRLHGKLLWVPGPSLAIYINDLCLKKTISLVYMRILQCSEGRSRSCLCCLHAWCVCACVRACACVCVCVCVTTFSLFPLPFLCTCWFARACAWTARPYFPERRGIDLRIRCRKPPNEKRHPIFFNVYWGAQAQLAQVQGHTHTYAHAHKNCWYLDTKIAGSNMYVCVCV